MVRDKDIGDLLLALNLNNTKTKLQLVTTIYTSIKKYPKISTSYVIEKYHEEVIESKRIKVKDEYIRFSSRDEVFKYLGNEYNNISSK